MGRIGLEGARFNNQPTYSALDLSHFSSPGVLKLSGNGGDFSVDNGVRNLGNFNDAAALDGDIADWASNLSPLTQSRTIGLASEQ